MSEDKNTSISPKRGMNVVLNTPIDKGLEEPRLSTTRLDMSSPFIAIAKTEKNSIDFEQQSEVMIAKETCTQLKTEMIDLLRKVYEASHVTPS